MLESENLKSSIALLTKLSFLLTKTEINIDNKLQEVVEILAEALSVKRCSLVLFNELEKRFEIVAATGFNLSKEEMRKIDPVKQSKIIKYVIENRKPVVVRNEDDMKKFGIKPKDKYKIPSFISVPLIVTGGKLLGVLNLTDTISGEPFTDLEAQTILILSDQIAITIENTKLSEQILRNRLIKEQLKIAKRVQHSLIPSNFPNNSHIDCYGFTIPTFEVGGDYFDILKVNSNCYAFILADVSGKGIPASLIMTSFRSYWRALVKNIKKPKKIFESLNNILVNDLEKEGLFLTCFYGIYNFEKNTLNYGNAGHEFPIFYCNEKEKFIKLEKNDLILGSFADVKYTTYSKKINNGDAIFIFSDGITDFSYYQNIDAEKIIEDIFLENKDKSMKTIISLIKKTLQNKFASKHHTDDLTLIGIRFKNDTKKKEGENV